ncbi:hypothetical protein BH11CYA1_BH11CYA1_41450 [soil metagenome]
MLDSSNATDSVVVKPDSVIGQISQNLYDDLSASNSAKPADVAQASQQLVDAGQIPALQIVSDTSSDTSSNRALESSNAFKAVISTDGLRVFNTPDSGKTDYFAQVDGLDDPGIFWNGEDGVITKSSIDSYISNGAHAPRRAIDPLKDQYINSLKVISDNWDNPEMAIYKDSSDSMTRDSFAAGVESVAARQATDANQTEEVGLGDTQAQPGNTAGPVDMPVDALPAASSTDAIVGPVDMPGQPAQSTDAVAAPLTLSDEAAQLSVVQRGEGPYQSAERILSSGGSPASHEEVIALVRAMQAQYREENPDDPNLAGLKVGHQFITTDKVDALLASISDPAMRETISAKIMKPAETAPSDTGTDIAPGSSAVPDTATATPSDTASGSSADSSADASLAPTMTAPLDPVIGHEDVNQAVVAPAQDFSEEALPSGDN